MVIEAPMDRDVGRTPRRTIPFEPLDIATERCKGCGLCVDVCPKHVLALDHVDRQRARLPPGPADRRGGLHELRAVRPGLPRRRVHRLRPPEASLR